MCFRTDAHSAWFRPTALPNQDILPAKTRRASLDAKRQDASARRTPVPDDDDCSGTGPECFEAPLKTPADLTNLSIRTWGIE
jgi:hypothetical protein